MTRLFSALAATLAACTPSSQDNAMHSSNPAQATEAEGSTETGAKVQTTGAASNPGSGRAADQDRAALGPVPEPVSAEENPAPAAPSDPPAEAIGRRTLSTAFVRVGPDGLLTVELHDGRVLVLRDAVLRRTDYCGVQVVGGAGGAKYCGGYAEVAAARPGGVPAPAEPDLAPANPLEAPRAQTDPK